ncbi:MAG: AarF/UbiB family protein [Acidimicrobiales bacterium]
MARRRLGPLATRKALGKPIDPARAPRIVAACADLGATYVKFGQLVASAPSVFGEEVSVAFRSLLDQGRPVGFHKVQHEVERATHEPLRTTFAEFDPEPVGRASMAVVHRAQLADGTDVAVKILRPGIERKVAADFQLMGWLIPAWRRGWRAPRPR